MEGPFFCSHSLMEKPDLSTSRLDSLDSGKIHTVHAQERSKQFHARRIDDRVEHLTAIDGRSTETSLMAHEYDQTETQGPTLSGARPKFGLCIRPMMLFRSRVGSV